MAEKKQEKVKEESVADQVVKKTEDLQEIKGQVLISGSGYWDFNEKPIFTGTFIQDVIKDDGPDEGKLIGYEFEENVTGELHVISNSALVTKALDMTVTYKNEKQVVRNIKDAILKIEFKGQRKNKDGQDVNVFRIELL